MPENETVSLHERLAVGVKYIELEKQGKKEEVMALLHTMPLPAYLAKWVKRRFGAEALIKTGWNLS
jgi:hypothetical protein